MTVRSGIDSTNGWARAIERHQAKQDDKRRERDALVREVLALLRPTLKALIGEALGHRRHKQKIKGKASKR